MAARGFLGAGDLYIARYNATTAQFENYAGPYECSKFELSPKSELKEQSSRSKAGYGQVIESVALNQPAEFAIALPEVNKESLLLALLGSDAAINQGSGTLTDEVIAAKLDKFVPLTKGNLATAGLVVTNSAGSITYVPGTDYVVNYRLGWIKALSTGAITEGQSLKVDATYAAMSGTRISGATSAQLRARFKLDGVNQVDGLPSIVTVHEAVLAANSAFDFMGNEFASVELSGRMKTPTGYTEPFTVDLYDAA